MTSTKRRKVVEHPKTDHQAQSPPLISLGDIASQWGILFLKLMWMIPVSQRVCILNRLSMFVEQFLYSFNDYSTTTIRQNMTTELKKEQLPGAIESCARRLFSLTIWNSLALHNQPIEME